MTWMSGTSITLASLIETSPDTSRCMSEGHPETPGKGAPPLCITLHFGSLSNPCQGSSQADVKTVQRVGF